MNASITSYMPGDILFYAQGNGSWEDVVISDWTGSPLVHVAIAVSALQKIEALAGGVILSPIDSRTVAKSFLYTKNANPLVAESLAAALTWLHSQVGQMYGWGDIANAFLAKWEHNFSVDLGEHYDCSGLACEFLQAAGGIKNLLGVNPHEVTPAGLAKLLGV